MAVKSTDTTLFGKSPFKGLQLHMESVILVANELSGLIEALNKGDQAKLADSRSKIVTLEGKADELKNSMRSQLPKSFFMPVDRRDLLDLLNIQDNIADNTEKIADLLVLRTLEVPGGMGKDLTELTALSIESCNKALKTIGELHTLIETGFSAREVDKIQRMIVELSALRTETSKKSHSLCKTLINMDQVNPVSVMIWYQVINHIAELAHNSEQVGDRLRLLMAQ